MCAIPFSGLRWDVGDVGDVGRWTGRWNGGWHGRFVAVREIARNAKIRSHIYKAIADPKGKLKARGLWGKDSEFSPHFLLYSASNVPIELDDSSGGSARRTRILDLPFNFVETPQAANERAAAEVREACFAYCGGEVPKKEVGLRLTRKGFMEDMVNYSAAFKQT